MITMDDVREEDIGTEVPEEPAAEADIPKGEAAEAEEDSPEANAADSDEPESEAEAPLEEADSSDDAALNELNKKYMRLAADFQNFKRRTEKEKSDIYQYANEKIALDIIEVMDNFERALAHAGESQDPQFAEGVEMIYKQLSTVLEKNNILEIEAEGKEFDPNVHNAVTSEESDEFESGTVIQAVQKGYTLNGKVIRPSMVRVAR